MAFSQEELDQIQEIVRQQIQSHTHDGNDSPQIDPMFLQGFPTFTAAPADDAPDGTIRLADVGGTRSIYVRIGGAWYSEVVT